jgi:hypothetical protein
MQATASIKVLVQETQRNHVCNSHFANKFKLVTKKSSHPFTCEDFYDELSILREQTHIKYY